MSIQIISAQQLPKINKDKQKSIVDPRVRVEIYGVPDDNASKQTHHIDNNGKCQQSIYTYIFNKCFLPKCRSLKCFFVTGFNPVWNTKFQFTIFVPELALVRFVVEDYDAASHNDLVGLYTLPFTSMQNGELVKISEKLLCSYYEFAHHKSYLLSSGYRHVPLLTKRGNLIPSAGLFVHIMALDAK